MTQMKAIRTTAFSQEQPGNQFPTTGCALSAERPRTSSRRSSDAIYPDHFETGFGKTMRCDYVKT